MASQAVRLDDVGMTPFLKKVTLFSSGGPFLEGYVLGVIGVALVKIVPELGIDSHWSGLLGVASIIGLFIGASLGGYLTDLIGRKKMFVLDIITIIILSIACALVGEPWQLFILRILIGITIGADYPIATSMIAEFTPAPHRAFSMGVIAAVWYVGANMAYIAGYFLLDLPQGWRWMLASAVIPCVIILVGRMHVPESPRWLYSKGRIAEAEAIIKEIYGTNVILDDEKVEHTQVRQLFQGTYMRRVLFVGIIWLCQAIPMFAIYTYGPQIISAFGLGSDKGSLIGEVVIGTFFMIGTIPAMFLAERCGRRPLILVSFAVMVLPLAILGLVPAPSIAVVITCFAAYALASGGPGNLEWLYPNELFPTHIRATAMGLAMALSRIGTVISIYVLPQFMEDYGMATTMLVGAGITFVGFGVSYLWAPETRGLSLAQTGAPEFRGR